MREIFKYVTRYLKWEELLFQPIGTLVLQIVVVLFGSLRKKERYGVLLRPQYAYGLLRAADTAKYFGKTETTVCEFGVGNGEGLLNMIALADRITDETGVRFRIFGFDTGQGLPEPTGYKDHPEFFSRGDFAMQNREQLVRRIGDRARILFGDIKDTVSPFMDSLDPASPLGFVAIDVDIYTAAKHALQCLLKTPDVYNPAVCVYLDDISYFFANQWCGELAAVDEFNRQNDLRKIDLDRSLPGVRPMYPTVWWHRNMFVCHVLDHEARNKVTRPTELGLDAFRDSVKSSHIQ